MIKILELFSGYGTATFALKRLGIPHKLVGYSDIDKYANQCFQQNHGGKELGDVRKINPNELEDFDLLTGGFPCQAFSMAGKMQGELDPRGTLFYEIIRIAEVKQPRYMLLENVKGLTTKKFESTFKKILSELNRIGYNVYWKVLNSKDFGIPQSRARVWFVCFRKDIDEPMKFQFPTPEPLKIFIKDILEEQVNEKYYLSEKLQERFAKYLEEKQVKINSVANVIKVGGKATKPFHHFEKKHDNFVFQQHRANEIREFEGIHPTLTESHEHKGGTNASIVYDRKGFDSRTKGFRENELSPTLSTKMGTGGNNIPMVIQQISEAIDKQGNTEQPKILDLYNRKADNDVCITLSEPHHNNLRLMNENKLRRLTPKECFRLDGFSQ